MIGKKFLFDGRLYTVTSYSGTDALVYITKPGKPKPIQSPLNNVYNVSCEDPKLAGTIYFIDAVPLIQEYEKQNDR